MSKFKADRIIIRELDTIDIIFWRANSIYVFYKNTNQGAVFHNWFEHGRYLTNWEPFRCKLLRYQNLTMAKCYELAAYHDVDHSGMGRALDLRGRAVELRNKRFRIRGVVAE